MRTVMKNIIPTLTILALLATASQADLIHYWPFDEQDEGVMYDEAVAQPAHPINNATWDTIDGAAPGYVAPGGKFGDAAYFGTSQRTAIRLADSGYGTLPDIPVTLSMWFKPEEGPEVMGVWFMFANHQVGGDQDRFQLQMYTHRTDAPENPGQTVLNHSVGANKDIGETGNVVRMGEWNHAFMVVDPIYEWRNIPPPGGWYRTTEATVTLVLNGNLEKRSEVEITKLTSGLIWNFDTVFEEAIRRIRVGSGGGENIEIGKSFTNGMVCDVAIWNEALPLEQALFIYNEGAGRRANVGSGRVAYDPYPTDRTASGLYVVEDSLTWTNPASLGEDFDMYNRVYFSDTRSFLIGSSNQPLSPSGLKILDDYDAEVPTAPGVRSIDMPEIDAEKTYYWRVDTIQIDETAPDDPNEVVQYGALWTFHTTNAPPIANAGGNVYTYLDDGSATVTLEGVVIDDGLPEGEDVTVWWEEYGGDPIPTTVVQEDAYTYIATTTDPLVFTELGTYRYTLVGDDTTGEGRDMIYVIVETDACAAAQANPDYVRNTADINNDCLVNFVDTALLADDWKKCTALDEDCD